MTIERVVDAHVHAYSGAAMERAVSVSLRRRNVSIITASSSVRSASIARSRLPGCGPWTKPAGCMEIDPMPMPELLRLMKFPAE